MRILITEENKFEIPLTPLIDVVFLLLIFFLVATNFNHKEYDQKVNLPHTTANNKSEYNNNNLVINIRDSGTIIINGRIISNAELTKKILTYKNSENKQQVIIRSDGNVKYTTVMKVMGMCKSAGIKKVNLPVIEDK